MDARVILQVALAAVLVFPIAIGCSPRDGQSNWIDAPDVVDVRFSEAPILAGLVALDQLPPVDDRLPNEPAVAETVEGVGRYGGQMRVFNDDLVPRGMWGSSLFRLTHDGIGQGPNLAAAYDTAEDGMSLTIFLRPGTKWSDGMAFTSEDIRFMYDDMHNYRSPKGFVRTWHATGSVTDTEVIDEYTIKLITPGGVGNLPMILAAWQGTQTNSYQPAHYLKNWHIEYNPDAESLAEEEGFRSWVDAMWHHYDWGQPKDLTQPKMTPWIPTDITTTTELHERNPYYWKVDPAGNQLPYIDRVVVQFVNADVYQLEISSGEADIAWAQTSADNLQLYRANEEIGDYAVVLHPGMSAGLVKLDIAKTHISPVLRNIFGDVRFRKAVSVAVDRKAINDTVYHGMGVERQYAPLETNSYYREEWGRYFAQYDPGLANQLLDEIGLDELDGQGYRMRPDGQTLSIVVNYYVESQAPVLELVKEYWEAVGLKTTLLVEDAGSIEKQMLASELFAYVQGNPSIPWANERNAFVNYWNWTGGNMRQWTDWLNAKSAYLSTGLQNDEVLPVDWPIQEIPSGVESRFPGIRPPDDFLEMRADGNEWLQSEMGSTEYERLAQLLFDYNVFNLMQVGYVGEVPDAVIVSNRLHNVPPPGWIDGMPFAHQYVSQWTDQFYLD